MEDTRFDALLRTAAADAARDDLQTANLQRAPRRARKPLRVFIAAAACVALLTTGVAAAWPQLEVARTQNGFSLSADGTGRAAAQELVPIELGYLPEGYTLDTQEGDGYYWAIVDDPHGNSLIISKCSLDNELTAEVTRVDEYAPSMNEIVDDLMDDISVLSSADDITTQLLSDYGTIMWTEQDCYYLVYMTREEDESEARTGMDVNEMQAILQNMQ